MSKAPVKVLVTASGSGGHLFPARFVIDALNRQETEVEVMFVGSGRPLEETIIGPTGVSCRSLTTVGLKRRGLTGLLQFLITTPLALLQTFKLFFSFKPDVVLGVGGYATFFPVVVAWLLRVPRWIHEAERKPGMANKVLSRIASKVSVAFPDAAMPKGVSTEFTGHPLRPELLQVDSAAHRTEVPKRLLVMGGSQGAAALDKAVPSIGEYLKSAEIEVWHQCRPESVDAVKAAYAEHGVNAQVAPFIHELDAAYRWAEIVISRAGAGAVNELGVVNIPCVLVPYPYAQDDHQTANARLLEEAGKAVLVSEGEGFHQRLLEAFTTLATTEQYQEMKLAEYPARRPDAASTIAVGCLELGGE